MKKIWISDRDNKSTANKPRKIGHPSTREAVVVVALFVTFSLAARLWFGLQASPSTELLSSLNLVKRWAAQLGIVLLSIFLFRYYKERNLASASIWLAETLFLYTLLMMFASAFTTLKSLRNQVTEFFADPFWAEFDRIIHFGDDPWRIYAYLLDYLPLQHIDYFYSVWWLYAALALTAVVAGVEQNERLRFGILRVYFFIWIVLGLLLAGLSSSGGPVYYDRITGELGRFADWQIYVDSLGYQNMRASIFTENLWQWYADGHEGIGGGIAAFPSVHVAMAALMMLYAFTLNRIAGFAGLIWLVIIQVGSVMLGWHYAIDGYFSIVVVVLVWRAFVPRELRGGRYPLVKRRS